VAVVTLAGGARCLRVNKPRHYDGKARNAENSKRAFQI